MALRLEETCPKCGSHLMVREGEDGDFLACPRFPDCKFTKPLPAGDLKIYIKPSPYCEKCNHTGLLPFVKNGKVVPNAFLDCSCRKLEQEQYITIKPEDFDFPCSYVWRAYYEETIYGRYLPALEVQDFPEKTEPHFVDTEWTKRQWDKLNQLKGEVRHLSSKVNELRADASKRRQYDIK